MDEKGKQYKQQIEQIGTAMIKAAQEEAEKIFGDNSAEDAAMTTFVATEYILKQQMRGLQSFFLLNYDRNVERVYKYLKANDEEGDRLNESNRNA